MTATFDTIVGIPSARPPVPAPDDLIPGLRETGVATYTVRRPWWVRKAPKAWAGAQVGGALACLLPVSYAIAQILGGQA